MNEYLDTLEVRDPQVRERNALAALPHFLAQSKAVPGWARILHGVHAADINSRAALAQLPVTRKSDLHHLQSELPPFGGLTLTTPHRLRRLFMSPGPIFDPEGHGADWWRCARPMYAAGARAVPIISRRRRR